MAIPTIFYTLNGIFGKTPDWLNIAIFFLSAALSFWVELKSYRKNDRPVGWEAAAFMFLCFICLLFVIFTFTPPEIPLFRDPLTGGYGIKA
jgi:hypothetical protein